ncbi:hypothetical protein [Amycolatopsis tolypomycina]|uniref:hypothetical protein n=1 Tax=Amycolatopsis tolypomycina TaxID=208445 RepID=UPI0033AB08B8
MTAPTAYEHSWARVMEELRGHPEIEVYEDGIGEFGPAAGDGPLDSSFRECFFRFEELSSAWGTPEELFGGEFFVQNIRAALAAPPPPLWYDPSPEELRFSSGLRVADLSRTGSAWLTAIRVEPGAAHGELWFDFDRKLPGYRKLDIGYAGYLAALQVTKGTSGWQLLFPGYDYEPLRRRLEERLGPGSAG